MTNDKSSPRGLANKLSQPDVKAQRHAQDVINARQEGFHEGQQKGRQEIIDWLQKEYLSDHTDRTTPEAKAILQLARDASLHLRGQSKASRR